MGLFMDIKILYEDNHIIVCTKKPGVLSQAGPLDLPDMLSIIKAYIKETYNKPGNVFLGLVHRLDVNVGGVMAFAKTSKAASRLSQQIRDHQFNKQYFAVVNGALETKGQLCVLEDYLSKDKEKKLSIISNKEKGQYAKLVYQTIESLTIDHQDYTLLDVELITGRFHQIRAQLGHRGYPLYGDNKYGQKTKGYEIGLFAYQLEFIHPVKKEPMSFIDYPKSGIFSHFKLFGGQTDE
jgi:23S rRNA pseudouridine1911/1915/1917 synthase